MGPFPRLIKDSKARRHICLCEEAVQAAEAISSQARSRIPALAVRDQPYPSNSAFVARDMSSRTASAGAFDS